MDAPPPARLSTPAYVLLIVCALILIGAGWLIAVPEEDTGTEPVPQAQAAAECLVGGSGPESRGNPIERVSLQVGDDWLRMYVADDPHWVRICEGDRYGWYQGFSSVIEPGPPGVLTFFGGFDAVAKSKVLIGTLPTGATRIEARLASGEVLPGAHDGVYFAIWARGAIVEGAQVTATGPDSTVIATAPAPAG
jgi:hypothetical protein